VKLFTFMTTPELAGAEFSGPSWSTWRIVARLIDGDAGLLSAEEHALALQLTGRTRLPSQAPREVFIGAGRRSGKTRFAALVSAWLAATDYSERMAPGETAVIAAVAPDRRQAALALDYAKGIIDGSELLRSEMVGATQDALEFRHRTRLEVATASYRTVRGRTMPGAIIDESAFLRAEDSALPDVELARALRPALLTLSGVLIVISSPHRKVGLLHDAFRRYYGNDAETRGLYIQATSRQLNPRLSEEEIDAAMAEDPTAAASEFLGLFRTDVDAFLDDALIDAATVPNRRMLPASPGYTYHGFCDPSGGRADSFTLAIAHADLNRRVVLDAVRVVAPPFQPEEVVQGMAETLGAYGLNRVTGDQYAGEWVSSAFRKYGISYFASERSKSEIYMEVLPLFTQATIELLDHPRLLTELRLLERRTRSGSNCDSVDHPRGAHDDVSNAACGALLLASLKPSRKPGTQRFSYAVM
jgi:hypothetical protein